MTENNLIIGRKPVLEAIISGKQIEKVYIMFGANGDAIMKVKAEARKRKIPISELPQPKFIKMLPKDANSQGVLALINNFKYFEFEQIVDFTKKKEKGCIVLLEEIQDTHNLGAIIRSAECLGVDGVLITKNNSAVINQTVHKTSAGAVEHVKIAKITSVSNTINYLKKAGFWIYGTSLKDSQELSSVKVNYPCVIIVANEEKGLKVNTAKNCDFLVRIPMKGKIDSLNVSVASGILMYELLR